MKLLSIFIIHIIKFYDGKCIYVNHEFINLIFKKIMLVSPLFDTRYSNMHNQLFHALIIVDLRYKNTNILPGAHSSSGL